MALALMTSACEGELHLQFEAARDASSGDGATSTPDANGLGDDGATDDSSDDVLTDSPFLPDANCDDAGICDDAGSFFDADADADADVDAGPD